MNIDIRKSIKENFKEASSEEISKSITESIKDKEEITLPGMGVFFEILWTNSSKEQRECIIDILKSYFSK